MQFNAKEVPWLSVYLIILSADACGGDVYVLLTNICGVYCHPVAIFGHSPQNSIPCFILLPQFLQKQSVFSIQTVGFIDNNSSNEKRITSNSHLTTFLNTTRFGLANRCILKMDSEGL